MAKHSAPQTVAVVPTGVTIIRPVAVSAEAYLGKLRAMAHVAAPPPGRHAR
ncbi:hypothetical protein PHK61_20905 [Actinomycetospora lutea]|uniref:hypothetical protein n=1 Tax=Actinomycetospora lutea TaxID=663604 RepID=UPI002367296F|nr:hypothetical protein [Actinomycetospora lutea]MDD7940887.1 hypothetical protein [Actinomycetospora lutea]